MTAGIQISQLPTAPFPLDGTELVPIVSTGTISGITQATNAIITLSDVSQVNPFAPGEQVAFANVLGMTEINALAAAVSAAGGVSGAWTVTVPINSGAFGAYASGGTLTATAKTTSANLRLSAGQPYNPTFSSGNVQYAGPNGQLAGDNNLIFGLSVPNPSGVNAPCLLIGSGGGAGTAVTACIIMDQAFDNTTPGNRLIITSGETQPAGVQPGGPLLLYGGASYGGTGGLLQLQGGSSAHAGGGPAVLKGGPATGTDPTNSIPGDAFVEGGDTGMAGANVHLIATLLNGVPGDVRIRINSTILVQFLSNGEIFLTHSGTGAGTAGQALVSGGIGAPAVWAGGYTGSQVIGSLTFTWSNGRLISVV